MKKSVGFTVIELMFVLVVLGVLSTAGILFYQQRVQNQKIEKTVAEIERWMQAGAAYYTRNKRWPNDAAALIQSGYMPLNADKKNPWCSANDNVDACYIVKPSVQGIRGQLLTIEPIIVGSNAVRQKIAARLAYVDNTVLPDRVVAWLNTSLVPLERQQYQEDIVVQIVPFTLTKDEFKVENGLLVLKIPEGKSVAKIPDCVQKYGEGYQDGAYAIIEDITPRFGPKQMPLFSETCVFFKKNNQKDVLLNIQVRTNEYELEASYNKIMSEPLDSFVALNFRVKGNVFVICERKKQQTQLPQCFQ